MAFPSPVAFWIGTWPVHWYGLSYGIGIFLAWLYCRFLADRRFPDITRAHLDDFITWGLVGVVVGGRLGHILFYYPTYYLQNPLEIFMLWKGGMAFHGGLLGVICAFGLYCYRHRLPYKVFADCWACGAPIGFFFGRLGNFVNQELYGRITSRSWGVIFPAVDAYPRHPSQLYEAALEGIGLFMLLAWAAFRTSLPTRPGALSGLFLLGYGAARWVSEWFREPLEVAWEFSTLTLGQLYSLPFMLWGGIWLWQAFHQKRYGVA